MAVHTFEEIRDEAERQGKVIDEQKKAGPATAEATAEKTAGETEKPESETDPDDLLDEAELPGESKKRAATPAAPKRDYVKEAYECFVKDAKDIDPTDPVKAIEVYFEKNATDELKARCKAEGKDAKGCWMFVEAVARKALRGSSGHIDPAVVYAIAMHWFEDVPRDWDKPAPSPKPAKTTKPAKTAKKTSKIEKLEQKVAQGQTAQVRQKAKEELRKAKAAKKRKSKTQQGFFFEMLETPVEGGTEK